MKKSEVPMYLLDAGHSRYLGWTRYGNSSGYAWAIVAVLQFDSDGDLFDWAVYMGGCDQIARDIDAVTWVAEHGNKMSREDAVYFFPSLPIEMYRG